MSPGNGTRTSSSLTGQSSPEPYDSELACFQPIKGGEIEVNSSALKSSMYAMRNKIQEQSVLVKNKTKEKVAVMYSSYGNRAVIKHVLLN